MEAVVFDETMMYHVYDWNVNDDYEVFMMTPEYVAAKPATVFVMSGNESSVSDFSVCTNLLSVTHCL